MRLHVEFAGLTALVVLTALTEVEAVQPLRATRGLLTGGLRRPIRSAFAEHVLCPSYLLLRMADLLALQPNMDIRLHIVAPVIRREKIFQELRRPVFSLLDTGPLAESCTFLSYDSVRELAQQPHLSHLSESVLDEYEEEAEG